MKTPTSNRDHGEGRRDSEAELPFTLFVKDLMKIFDLTAGAIRKAIHRGEFGKYIYVGRRLAVLRETLLARLTDGEIEPPGRRSARTNRPATDAGFREKMLNPRTRGVRGDSPGSEVP